MEKLLVRTICTLIVTATLLAGCASPHPTATKEEDQRAKNIKPSSGMALIFIIRPDMAKSDKEKKESTATSILLDDTHLKQTLSGHFLVTEVAPGAHTVSVDWKGMKRHNLKMEYKKGVTYFIQQEIIKDGLFPKVSIKHIEEEEGRKLLNLCTLSLMP